VHITILVSLTIEAQWSIDLELPGDIAVHTLILALLEVCGVQASLPQFKGPIEWGLGLKNSNSPFDPTRSLVDAGVLDGAELTLQSRQTWSTRPVPPPFVPRTIQPGQGGISITWNREGLRS
jgi:hypothetical protein